MESMSVRLRIVLERIRPELVSLSAVSFFGKYLQTFITRFFIAQTSCVKNGFKGAFKDFCNTYIQKLIFTPIHILGEFYKQKLSLNYIL